VLRLCVEAGYQKHSVSKPKLARFAQDVKNVSTTERPSLDQAALDLRATPGLNFIKITPASGAFVKLGFLCLFQGHCEQRQRGSA
jgi:hypothetical protein